MQVTDVVKYIVEFLGTAIFIAIGNAAVANVVLKGTKGKASGWLTIAVGYGVGLMIPVMMFGNVSGGHFNPALTLGLATFGYFSWAKVPFYIIAQLLGAFVGQAIVVAAYRPYYTKTKDAGDILSTFSTINNLDDGTKESRRAALINGFINELFGSFIFFFAIISLTKNYFGAQLINQLTSQGVDTTTAASTVAPYTTGSLAVANLTIGFLLMVMVVSFGGTTGAALNPARDLGPRVLHAILPNSVLGEAKSDSKWWYAWVPVVAPIVAAIVAAGLYHLLFS